MGQQSPVFPTPFRQLDVVSHVLALAMLIFLFTVDMKNAAIIIKTTITIFLINLFLKKTLRFS